MPKEPTLAQAIKNVIKAFPGTTFFTAEVPPDWHRAPQRKRRSKDK